MKSCWWKYKGYISESPYPPWDYDWSQKQGVIKVVQKLSKSAQVSVPAKITLIQPAVPFFRTPRFRIICSLFEHFYFITWDSMESSEN